jgi:RsmE family RNA methyltransferase
LSHRRSVPKLSIVNSLKEIDFGRFDNVYLCDEDTNNQEQIKREKNIAIVIGPEGGIDNEERSYFKGIAKTITLGSNILSTESSSLAILSLFLQK